MLTNTKQIKILLYGNVSRDYRSKILVKFLLDSKYRISLASPEFYTTKKVEHFYSIEKLFTIFWWIELFIKAAFTDIIYLPPMNARFIKSALWASKLFNKKLIVEMYISLYDTLVNDRNLITTGSRQAKTWLTKDILALTKSDYIIHTARHEITYWENLLNIKVKQNKVFIAPICNISSLVRSQVCGQGSVLNICWWGTFIPLHGLDNILQSMRILKAKNVQFICNLFGVNNSFFHIYTEKIQTIDLNSHVFLRKDLSFANSYLPKYLVENCDLALGIFGNTDKARNAVPNKLIEALSMGIPTLTMNSPALREFFNPEDLWTCEPSPESIAASILTIAEGTASPVDWEQTRQKVLSTFSVAQYQEVVSKVLKRATDDLLGQATSNVESGVLATHQAAINQTES